MFLAAQVKFMKAIVSIIDQMNEWLGKAASWLLLPLVLIVCFDVVARKLFNFSRIWIMDLEWHLFALIFLLAAGYTLKHNRHVRVDLFYDKFEKKEKGQVDFFGSLIFLLPWSIIVLIYAFDYAAQSLAMNEGASEPGGLPARYLIKFAVPIAIFMLLLQGLSLMYKAWLAMRGDEDQIEPKTESPAEE